MENVQVFVYIIGKTLGILLLLNCHFRNAAATCEKEEKSIWKVNVLKFVATNKCNLDIKSSLHFPQFCYCFSFLALLDFKTTFIWILSFTLLFNVFFACTISTGRREKLYLYQPVLPLWWPGGGCDVNIVDAWYGVRTGAEWRVVAVGSIPRRSRTPLASGKVATRD